MKKFILTILISTSAIALPQNGTYKCVEGNKPSICDQEITMIKDGIRVYYVGDCVAQGPYLYSCEKNHCQDEMGVINFEFNDDGSYRWENQQYEFNCKFQKVRGTHF